MLVCQYLAYICVIYLIDVILVKSDSIIQQPSIRDQKIIRSLSKKYPLLVLGWNREGISREIIKEYPVALKLFSLRAPSGAPSLLLYLPFFWTWVLIRLIQHRPKIIHSCDLETIIPCYIFKIFSKAKLIFDVFDRYAMAYVPRQRNFIFGALYAYINFIEEYMAERSDVLINVSDELLKTFRRRPKNCVTIMNCAEDHDLNKKSEGDEFTVAFTGHVARNRGLENIISVIKDLRGVKLVVTGRVQDEELLNKIKSLPYVRYTGFLQHSDVLTLQTHSGVMIALYDLEKYTQNKFVMGNKIFEAMMCAVPIISNVACELIEKNRCGIIVQYADLSQIKSAIISLRDNPDLRKTLGENGRKAFLEKYNWNLMEQKLYEIYDGLLQK